jgi:protein-tyrosine-phosphatase
MPELIDHDLLIEMCRDALEASVRLCPKSSRQEHLDRAAASISALTDAPDPWLESALNAAVRQLLARRN